MEQLIIYGADLDAQTANLDIPLHICALNNHETCLRLLLKHGATRDILNKLGQTPSEAALLTRLCNVADLIENFPEEQIGTLKLIQLMMVFFYMDVQTCIPYTQKRSFYISL